MLKLANSSYYSVINHISSRVPCYIDPKSPSQSHIKEIVDNAPLVHGVEKIVQFIHRKLFGPSVSSCSSFAVLGSLHFFASPLYLVGTVLDKSIVRIGLNIYIMFANLIASSKESSNKDANYPLKKSEIITTAV